MSSVPAKLTRNWYTSPFTGLLTSLGPAPRRAHDPDVAIWAGNMPGWGGRGESLVIGGAGWDDREAESAALGEAIERWQARQLPQDEIIESSYQAWPVEDPAVPP